MTVEIQRELLHQTIDKLPENALMELTVFIEFLQFKIQQSQQIGGLDEAEDQPTLEEVVAKIKRTPKNPANFQPATESLAEGLANSPYEHDPHFDAASWNEQWDEVEAEMKAQELVHEQSEKYI